MSINSTVAPSPAKPGAATGTIQIYNTMTRQKEPLVTIEPGVVRMYVCGVTVYDHAHIGHGMSAIIFDVIRRYLEHRGYKVLHAQNFTDVDDKIIARANRAGIDPAQLTEQMIAEWMADVTDLNILPATYYPRATEEIEAIITMVSGLIERGFAYEADGDVYYRVRSFPQYGKLSHRQIGDLLAGARIEVDERKEDPLDFALWKAAKPGEPRWPSPWSEGRPGWHIECSSMCMTHLGGKVDIHGGGQDLIFPHHENEIAQSEAFLGSEPFARYWVHNGMLQLAGEKMSKSLGNILPVRDILNRGLGAAFRLMVLQSHYRAPLTYSEEGLLAAERGLDRLRTAATPPRAVATSDEKPTEDLSQLVVDVDARFHEAMSDDFDTPGAVAALFDLARAINRANAANPTTPAIGPARDKLIELATVLGLDLATPERQATLADAAPFIELLLNIREELRAAKAWALADKIRDELAGLGIVVEDEASGTTWRPA